MTRHNYLRLVVSNETPEDSTEHDWYWLEWHERRAEHYRRKLGLLATEHGISDEPTVIDGHEGPGDSA